MSSTTGPEVRRARRAGAVAAVAVLAVAFPAASLEGGSAARLRVSAAPIQSWTIRVLPSGLPMPVEAEVADDAGEGELVEPVEPVEEGDPLLPVPSATPSEQELDEDADPADQSPAEAPVPQAPPPPQPPPADVTAGPDAEFGTP